MSKENLIKQSFTCVDCGSLFEIYHNEIQECTYCCFCNNDDLLIESFDENIPYTQDFNDSLDDDKDWEN
jgi:hypothetical protein